MQEEALPWSPALCSAVAAAMAMMADLQTGVVDRPPLIKVLQHFCSSTTTITTMIVNHLYQDNDA